MKIALYYPWIYLKSGVERTILETVKKSKNEYTVFTNHFDINGTYPEFAKLNVVELKKIPIRTNLLTGIYASIILVFQKINLSKYDLFMVHSEGFADLVMLRNNKLPTICLCYTPLRPVFDESNKNAVLNQTHILVKPIYKLFIFAFSIIDVYLWSKYKYVIFISREVLRRAKSGGLLANHKYKILYPGVNWKNIKPGSVFKKYFFLPGRITWSKNIELAIRSFNLFFNLRKSNIFFKLVIAGNVDTKSKEYYKKLKTLTKNNKNIHFVLSPSEKTMKRLYSFCYATLATAFNEDWGLTLIEANAYGKPVIAIKSGGYKESQKDGYTGFLIENRKEKFASKMNRLSGNVAFTQKLGKQARIYSQKFSWGKFIEDYDKIINRVYYRKQK